MQSTQCLECKHYEGQHTCRAFPVKIPEEIMTGVHDHAKPFKNDKGIRFEPIEE